MNSWAELSQKYDDTLSHIAKVKTPKDRRLAASADNARKELERERQGLLDQLVQSALQTLRPLVLVGGLVASGPGQARFIMLARRDGAILDAAAAYEQFTRDVASRGGVLSEAGTPTPLSKPKLFTSDMLHWIAQFGCGRWTGMEGSHYGRREALASRLCSPAHPGHDVTFTNHLELLAIVKGLYRKTNLAESFARCTVQDQLRELIEAKKLDPNSLAILYRVDDAREAEALASLFVRKPVIITDLPSDVTRKFVADTIKNRKEQE